MEKPSYKLVGAPCGQHGQYTFYKAIRLTGERDRIVAIGDFFFVRIWQDSELVSIGELQLLWTDRVSDQTLVSLRLYFLPENTPDGRGQHGEDEVLAINDKVVVRAEDLLSWVSDGINWRWGLRAVWRGACAPPADPRHTAPLHHTKLDFTDVDREKSTIVDADCPGVVVFSYPRYCRYRALLARLEGIQGDWLRDSLVAALGGYAAPTKNTRILYCKETFEYPELEGHEFVCNHLAPRLKGRPRGRRRRALRSPLSPRSRSPRSRTRSRTDRSSDSDVPAPHPPRTDPMTPRRLSLRNGAPPREGGAPPDVTSPTVSAPSPALDKAFLQHLRHFYTQRNLHLNTDHNLKHLSLRGLYAAVWARGGYEAVCRHKLWRSLSDQPARTRRHYERFLLPYENHERRNGTFKINGKIDEPRTIATIDVTDSPLRDVEHKPEITEKILRTPSPKHEKFIDNETGEIKEELNVISKPAEELNREFLDSLSKEDEKFKISVKPVEKLIEPKIVKLFEENSALISELVVKHNLSDSSKVIAELGSKQLSRDSTVFLSELAQKLDLGNSDTTLVKDPPVDPPATITVTENSLNGHDNNPLSTGQQCRPVGRSSLRAVRVKPTRAPHTHTHTHSHTHPHPHSHTHTHSHSAPPSTPPGPPLRPDSSSSSPPANNSAPPLNNFGIHHPPLVRSNSTLSDDEIVEVPYKPKTPEIIDLDEYPESPQSVKKKKLDILKERGLEVTALPTTNWSQPLNPIPPLINPPMILNPAMQHQIMTQAQLFQMYNIIPPNYSNGIQPPKVIQATSIFGSAGPEKTVYGNPKDPFMPPPHVLLGTPVKSQRIPPSTNTPPHDILDLTCRDVSPQKPAVEIVRIPNSPSPSKTSAQNLSKNYTLIDGKAVVGSNLEITLVNKVQTPSKNRPPQKRSSNGKFMSTKTPTPPKDYPKPYACPSPSNIPKKPQIVVPNYQISREDISPTSSTGSTNSQNNLLPSNMPPNPYKNNLAQIMEMQKNAVPMTSFMDPYMALYSSLAGQMDQRQLAVYRDLMANQFRGYSGLLNLGAVANTPTTKN